MKSVCVYDADLYATTPPGVLSDIISRDAVSLTDAAPRTLKVANVKYVVHDVLGRGGFGKVYLVSRGTDDTPVALKVVESKHNSGLPSLMEVSIMSMYAHPNLVSALRTECGKNKVYIFQEAAVCDLTTLRRATTFTPQMVRVLFYSTLRALEFLHGESIIHADVKDSNILVYGESDYRLADGSLAYHKAWPKSHMPCTKEYRPLEGWSENWDESVDIFALGCTLYRIVFNQKLFVPQNVRDATAKPKRYINALLDWESVYARRFLGRESPPSQERHDVTYNPPYVHSKLNTNDDLIALMITTLHPQAGARPSAWGLLQSPLFEGLDTPAPRPLIRVAQLSDDTLRAYTKDPHVLGLATRIKSRYLSTNPTVEDPTLLDQLVVVIARKMYKRNTKVSLSNQLLALEREVCRRTQFMLHY